MVFRYVVEGDRGRIVPSSVCAIILICSADGGRSLREQMWGRIPPPQGIDVRELPQPGLAQGAAIPRLQIDKCSCPRRWERPRDRRPSPPSIRTIRLDLWDGTRTWLPDVAKAGERMMLERVALARAIPIEGGTGLVDDLGTPSGSDHDGGRPPKPPAQG